MLNFTDTSSLIGESRLFQKFSQCIRSFSDALASDKILGMGRVLLCALLFSCIFIPRFPVGSITPFYQVDIRVEDLLSFLIGILLIFSMTRPAALQREFPRPEKAFLWFLFAAEVSILNGILFRTIDKPLLSLLYLLKWAEYFLVFMAVVRFAASPEDSQFFLKIFFLLGIAVAAYGYFEHFFPVAQAVYPNYYRLFERPPFHGDANHIGGFLVLWLGFFTGLFLKTEKPKRRLFLFSSLIFVLFPFIWTYSRKSYFALAGALAFAFLFQGSRKKLIFLICSFTILALFLPTRFSERLLDLGEAFTSTDPFHSSWAGNWVMWKQSLWNFDKFFLFGSGLGSRHRLFYESQYILVLTETGIFGALAFLMMGVALVREMLQTTPHLYPLPSGERTEVRGVTWGWLIGFVGLLIHNASCVTWTVSKAAIPFWFLTAAALTCLRPGEAK